MNWLGVRDDFRNWLVHGGLASAFWALDFRYRTSMASKYFGTVTTELGDAAFTSARND